MCVGGGGGGGGGIPFKKQCKSFRKFEEKKRVPWPRLNLGTLVLYANTTRGFNQQTRSVCAVIRLTYTCNFLGL